MLQMALRVAIRLNTIPIETQRNGTGPFGVTLLLRSTNCARLPVTLTVVLVRRMVRRVAPAFWSFLSLPSHLAALHTTYYAPRETSLSTGLNPV